MNVHKLYECGQYLLGIRINLQVGYFLILGGAIGNLIDRIVYQSVVDFMYFHFYDTGFFVNNFADDIISVGFVVILASLTKKDTGEGKK